MIESVGFESVSWPLSWDESVADCLGESASKSAKVSNLKSRDSTTESSFCV